MLVIWTALLTEVFSVNYFCRPVASPENVTETLAPRIHSDQRQFRESMRFR